MSREVLIVMSYQRKQPMYASVYQNSVENGFSVVSARQSSGVGRVPVLRTEMNTPYTYNGSPLMAVSVTDLSAAKGDALRQSHDTELWTVNGLGQRDRNLEDVAGGDYTVQGSDGKDVSGAVARDNVSTFASAASEYPHVFMYDEYVEARTPINERLGVNPPNEVDYEKYLDSMFRQFGNKDFTFVGEITKRSDMNKARQSLPSFQAGMDEFTKDTESPEFAG